MGGGKRKKLPEADLATGLTALSRRRDPLNDPAIRRTAHFHVPCPRSR